MKRNKRTIIKICQYCQKEYEIKWGKRDIQKFCSRACANSFYKTRLETHLVSICPQCFKEFKHTTCHSSRKFCSTKCKYENMSQDPNIAERFSKTATETMINGEKYSLSSQFKWGWFETNKNKNGKVFYRSSYELAALHLLDKDKNVKEILVEALSIEYEYNGKKKRYVPDFLITYQHKKAKKHLIEVKPSVLKDLPRNILKFDVAKQYCRDNNMIFEIWDEAKITKEAIKRAQEEYTSIPKEQLFCLNCNKQLIYSPSSPRKFCSKQCHIDYNSVTKKWKFEKECLICGSIFLPKYEVQKYCCEECKREAIGRTRRKTYEFVCENCGATYQRHRSNKRRFCSIECLNKQREKERLANPNNAYKNEIRTCPVCNKGYKPVYPPQIYCSIECSAKMRKQVKKT